MHAVSASSSALAVPKKDLHGCFNFIPLTKSKQSAVNTHFSGKFHLPVLKRRARCQLHYAQVSKPRAAVIVMLKALTKPCPYIERFARSGMFIAYEQQKASQVCTFCKAIAAKPHGEILCAYQADMPPRSNFHMLSVKTCCTGNETAHLTGKVLPASCRNKKEGHRLCHQAVGML